MSAAVGELSAQKLCGNKSARTQRSIQEFGSIAWIEKRFQALSECGRYELRGVYVDGRFEWRGRLVATDELIAASWDRSYVDELIERHARGGVR